METLRTSIIHFNADPEVKSLRDYYSVKSYMEILSKSRSENAHSSFLKWLFEGKEFASSNMPLQRLLNLLILNDGKGRVPVDLEQAVLSGKAVLGNTVVDTEKCIKDISVVKSRDRVDIFLNTSLDGVNGFDELSVVIENKLFSAEGMPKNCSKDLHKAKGKYAEEYNALSQTRRYEYAYCDERAFDKSKKVARLFVYLTPSGAPKPNGENFIHITYQNLLDYVLSPLACDQSLSERNRDIINDYIRALSVPASSYDNDEFTILAVNDAEKSRLKDFWAKHQKLIRATSPTNQHSLDSDADKSLAADFWDVNKVLFYAVYKAIEDHLGEEDKKCFESVSSKDYTKYSVTFNGETVYNLSKRKVVLLVVEKLISLMNMHPDAKLFAKMRKSQKLVYGAADFKAAHARGEISDDTYNNRYSPILDGAYFVNNQWGVGNFEDFIEAAESAFVHIKSN